MTRHVDMLGLRHASAPRRELELSAFLSSRHAATAHHLSASECQTMTLVELLCHADPADRARWDGLTLAYTDPLGAPWLRDTIASGYGTASSLPQQEDWPIPP